MDLESGIRGRQLVRTPASATKRALSGAARLIYNTAKSGYALPVWSNLAKRARVGYLRSRSAPASVSSGPPAMARRSMRRRGARRSRRSGTGRPITRQNDQSLTYTAGRRRRGSGRRSRRFRYRILQTVNSMQPLQIFTVKGANLGTSAVNTQQINGIGIMQTRATGANDLERIFTDAGLAIGTAANRSSRIAIKSYCLDIELRNNGSSAIIMDVYTLLLIRDPETQSDLYQQFQDMFALQTSITSSAWNDPAVSAFENPVFCRHYKVLSKREVLLNGGEIMTMQMRSGKDRFVDGDIVQREQFGIPGVTKFYFFSWHGSPDATAGAGSTPALAASSVTFTWQKSYKYAIMPGKQTGGQRNV